MFKQPTAAGGVLRLVDGACVPDDPRNADWRDYQKWVAAGNTPQPADAVANSVPEITAEDLHAAMLRKGGVPTREEVIAERARR